MGKAVGTIQPGQERPFPIGGNYLTVVSTRQLLEIELVGRNDKIEAHLVKQGVTLYEKNFDSIVVKNEGAEATDIVLVSGVGKYSPSQDGGRVEVDTSGGSVAVTLDEAQLALQVNQQTTGDTLNGLAKVTIAAGVSAQLAPANALRKYLRINILSSSDTEYILLGGADANSGGALERGMVGFEETTGAVSAFNPSTDPVDVYLLEVTD